MARTIFGTAFALLFFAYIKQGLHGVEVSHHETLNATVGENISLPCIVKQQSNSNIRISQIEWSKKDAHNKSHNKRQTHKMVVYSPSMGTWPYWPNVSIQLMNDDQMPNVSVPGRLIGSILHLGAVEEHDSGVYLCDITTFPDGSFRTETKLKVKGVEIECNRNRSFTANPGENVTINCSVNTASDARYNWTKDKRPLSQNDSLQLWRVGDAEAGSYTLTIQTGNDLLYAVFNITVLARNTSSETESTPSNATEESRDQIDQTVTPSESTHMTSPSTGYANTSTWTMGVDTNMTAFKTDFTTSGVNHTISPGTVRSLTTEANVSTTHSSSDRFTSTVSTTHSSSDRFTSTVSTTHSSSDRFTSTDLLPANTTSTENLTTHTVTNRPTVWSESNPRNANEWTTLVYGASSTQEISNSDAEERATRAEMDPDKDTSAGDTSDDAVQEDTSSGPAHRWLIIFFVILILALVVLVGFLYRKHTIKKKMDLPPPFKPPPPPTKYTSLIPQEFPVNGVMTTTV